MGAMTSLSILLVAGPVRAGDMRCQVDALIHFANNHELLPMAAPKPVLIFTADRDDSFPLAGVRNVAAYGRRLDESYGAAETLVSWSMRLRATATSGPNARRRTDGSSAG
jgi:hypothetical protein